MPYFAPSVVFVDSAAYTVATDNVAAIGGVYEASITAVSDGDVGALAMDSNRRLLVSLEVDNAGIGGGTQYAVDGALGSTPTGTLALASRDDALSSLTPVEGDAVGLRVDANGALWVIPSGTVTVSATALDIRALTNSDVVTAELSATDNAVLDTINTAVELIDDAIYADDAAFTLTTSKVMAGGAIRDDTLSTLTAVEGDVVPLRVSSTGALHVTGGGGGTQYSVDDAGPTVVTMAGVVRDDSLTTLTEVDGDATVLRVNSTGALHVTGAGGGTQYAEDAAHTTGDTGTMALGVRQDTPGNLSGTDGDYEPLQVSAGRLWTSTLVTGDALTALQLIDDAIYADDDAFTLASSKVMAGGAIRDDTLSTLTAIEGDVVPLRVSSTGALHVTGGGGGTQYAEDAGHTTGDTGTMALGVRQDTPGNLSDIDGDYEPFQVSAGRLWTSTLVTGDALTSLQLIDNPVATISATDVFRVGVFDDSDTQITAFKSTQYNEDSAHVSENTGTMALAVRQDTPGNLSDTDNDYEPLQVSAGRLWTSTLVTGDALTALQLIDDAAATIGTTDVMRVAIFDDSDTQITSFGSSGGTSAVDDAAFTAATDSGTPIMGFVTTDTVDSGDVGAVKMTTSRHLSVQIASDATGIAGNTSTLTSLVVAEDDAGGATPQGTISMAIRDDALSSLTPVEGDAVATRCDANGAIWVSPTSTATISSTDVTRVAIFDDSDTQVTSFGGTQYAEDAAHTTGDTGTMALGVRQDTPGNLSDLDGDYEPIQVSAGRLWASTLVTGDALTALQLIDDAVATLGTDTYTETTTKGNVIGAVRNDTLAALADTDNEIAPFQVNELGALWTSPAANASGGATPGKLISAATDNSTNIKASAGTLYMCTVVNTNASARYLKFYDKSSAPTVGTDVPVLVFTIPGNSNGAGIAVPIPACGLNFASGIGFGIVTGAADSDTNAVAANEIVLSYAYK